MRYIFSDALSGSISREGGERGYHNRRYIRGVSHDSPRANIHPETH
jgi:hypothetical protein